MRRRDLEAALDAVPDFPNPSASLEQYRTPSAVAAALLWEAHDDGDIAGKKVLDLGCGTGTLALGAHLLGAQVFGVDASAEAVAIAQDLVPGEFTVSDLQDYAAPAVDTVVMNPPFGSQSKGADRIFHAKAAQAADTVWFLHQPVNEKFLRAIYRDNGMEVERVAVWDYPLPRRFDFHAESLAGIKVGGYVATR